jgi:sigma-E factor negative regulatory protein RseC
VEGRHRRWAILVFVLFLGHFHEEICLNQKVEVVLEFVTGSAAPGFRFSLFLLMMADLAVCYIIQSCVLLVVPGNVAEEGFDNLVGLQVGTQHRPSDSHCHEQDSDANQKFRFNSSARQLHFSRKTKLMSRTGTVLNTSGDHALIATNRRGICDGCTDRSKCSFDDPFTNATEEALETITALNPVHAQPHDHVEFDLPGHTELSLSALVWVVPLLGLIIGAFLGANAHQLLSIDRDSATLLGLVSGAAVAYAVLRRIDRKAAGDERLTPVIQKILSSFPSTTASCSSRSSCPGPSNPEIT